MKNNKNILWVCAYGEVRSPTAANLYGGDHKKIEDLEWRDINYYSKIILMGKDTTYTFIYDFGKEFNMGALFMTNQHHKIYNLPIMDDYGELDNVDLVDKIISMVQNRGWEL